MLIVRDDSRGPFRLISFPRGRNKVMLYHAYELTHAAIAPWRAAAGAVKATFANPLNPWAYTGLGKTVVAAADVFESTTRRYGKPDFGIKETLVDGEPVPVAERRVWDDTFCSLLHFEKQWPEEKVDQPRVLVVAPLSGHYATLLRGTVEGMLESHDVYITDWEDAREVPIVEGRFDLDDYIDYVMAMIRHLGPNTHVMAVCQPGPAVLAATALMAAAGDEATPASMIIMGSPIDARQSPTVPNLLAEEKTLAWFNANMISTVPLPHSGAFRRVYPGFVQLSSFISMNRDKHVEAHWNFFNHLVEGDGDSADKHRTFYDEYLSVMDLTEEFYLQTVDRVFQRHLLAKGEFDHRGTRVDPGAITGTGLLTIEGELDDISGIGQTQAAHELCTGIPADMQEDYVQAGVGHYGVFNGTRWRTEICPRVTRFIKDIDARRGA
jgi:poly(3-hydroxybutyrate) depolymerase